MTVLVTGGAGYIGSHMVLELLDQAEKVVVLDDLSAGSRAAVPDGVDFVLGDVGDQALLKRIFADHRIDAVLHFAAKTVVPASIADPLTYYDVNVAKTLSLLQAMVTAGAPHIVFSSTAAVYGETQSVPVAESAPTMPLSPYGRSKLMAETMVRDVSAAHPLSHVCLRYFNVAGADPQGRAGQSTPHATHLVKVAAQAALGIRERMDVFGADYPTPDGSCIRDFVQVTDLVRAHMAALRHLRRGGESLTCNCGYGHGRSVLEIIKVMKMISGRDFPVTAMARRAGDMAVVVADNTLIQRALGWRPRHDDLHAIVRQAFDWERMLLERQAGDP